LVDGDVQAAERREGRRRGPAGNSTKTAGASRDQRESKRNVGLTGEKKGEGKTQEGAWEDGRGTVGSGVMARESNGPTMVKNSGDRRAVYLDRRGGGRRGGGKGRKGGSEPKRSVRGKKRKYQSVGRKTQRSKSNLW